METRLFCCCYSVAKSCPALRNPRTAACQASFTITQSVLKLMSIDFVMLANHFTGCCPLLLLSSIFPSIKVFFNESSFCIRWTDYWSFSFSINPSNEYSGLTSIRVDWFVLLAVQGTQESSPTPQFESIHSSVLSLLYGATLISIHDYCIPDNVC